jgi:hypothetical protein
MHQSAGTLIAQQQVAPKRDGGFEATPPKRIIDGFVTCCDYANHNLRMVGVAGATKKASAPIDDARDIAGCGVADVADIAAIDPQMPASQAIGAAGVDLNAGLGHRGKVASIGLFEKGKTGGRKRPVPSARHLQSKFCLAPLLGWCYLARRLSPTRHYMPFFFRNALARLRLSTLCSMLIALVPVMMVACEADPAGTASGSADSDVAPDDADDAESEGVDSDDDSEVSLDTGADLTGDVTVDTAMTPARAMATVPMMAATRPTRPIRPMAPKSLSRR